NVEGDQSDELFRGNIADEVRIESAGNSAQKRSEHQNLYFEAGGALTQRGDSDFVFANGSEDATERTPLQQCDGNHGANDDGHDHSGKQMVLIPRSGAAVKERGNGGNTLYAIGEPVFLLHKDTHGFGKAQCDDREVVFLQT